MRDDETADNILDELFLEDSTSPVEDKPDSNTTKDYSERLNKDREKIRLEEQNNIAKSMGYDSWEAYNSGIQNQKLVENGLNPDTVKPIIEELLKANPEYQEAMRYKAEKEKAEKDLWAQSELKKLNESFGTEYTDINQLSEEVIKSWNGGMNLSNAYAAFNYATIIENAKKSVIPSGGKDHMVSTPSGGSTPRKSVSRAELDWFYKINPDATKEEVDKYINNK